VWKDGTKHKEHVFTTTVVDEKTVKFTDQQGRETGPLRIKYMEYAEGMNTFPCREGYRHMHFAKPNDMRVMVPAAAVLTTDDRIQNMLGFDRTVGRILKWGRVEDRKLLENSSAEIRLFNQQRHVR